MSKNTFTTRKYLVTRKKFGYEIKGKFENLKMRQNQSLYHLLQGIQKSLASSQVQNKLMIGQSIESAMVDGVK